MAPAWQPIILFYFRIGVFCSLSLPQFKFFFVGFIIELQKNVAVWLNTWIAETLALLHSWLAMSVECEPTFWLSLPVASRNTVPVASRKLRMWSLYNNLPKFFAAYHIHIFYTCCEELVKSVGSSHGRLKLLFVMQVTVLLFVINSFVRLMTALIVMFPSKCCCGDFYAIS